MKDLILVINTGSSSTKIALFKDSEPLLQKEFHHSKEELKKLNDIIEEINFRYSYIEKIVSDEKIDLNSITAIGAIGGILKPLQGSVYKINEIMVNDILEGRVQAKHASNISAIIAYNISKKLNVPSFIVDPISTDELSEIARVSGLPFIPRKSRTHALNVKACVRKAKKELSLPEESNFIVVHIGGGLTINLVCNDRIVDIEDARQYGPFSTDAAGGVTIPDFIEYVFNEGVSKDDAIKYWYGKGGITAHLGVNSIKDALSMVNSGDNKAKLILDAMCYQIAKSIGALYVASKGKIDAIIITGGAARAEFIIDNLRNYIYFLGKIIVYPGEEELNAIAESIILALKGELPIKEYT